MSLVRLTPGPLLRLAAAALAGALVAGLVAAGPPAAATDLLPPEDADPVFLGWTAALPPAVGAYAPSSEDECTAGRDSCVKRTIQDMRRRLDKLGCQHNAIFALAYLRTTEEYAVAAAEPGFFADVPYVNHEDAVFAEYYFAAYDAWAAAAPGVPEAWRVAFDAAAARRVSANGNLLLGMNAHVNRDLPYVLASIGIAAPDGTTRKGDHDQVNVFLNRVVRPLLDEAARRYDPTIDDAATPYGLSYTVVMQLLLGWREQAWRNAERLVAAPDAAARARVAADIEDTAAATARLIAAATAYPALGEGSAARDAHCAAHR